jgi:hypothetical protein
MILSYGFFPLALLLLEEALDRRSYVIGALFALVAAMMTVGRDQVAFLSAVTLAGMVVFKVCEAERGLVYLKQRAGVLLTMVLIGGGLLAVPALLTMQFLMTSSRPSFGFGVAAMGSLPPESLATILFGNVFGSLRWTYDYWGPGFDTVAEGTWTDRAINYLFAGTLPALLVLWHGIAGRRLFAREFRLFLIVGVLAVLYALGRYTPVFEFIFDYLPGINLYRRPADATFLINIALAFASGYLVHRYLAEGAPSLAALRRSPLAAVFAAAAVALVGAAVAGALAFAVPAKQTANALTDIALAALIASGAVLVIVKLTVTPRARLVAASLIVAFTGGELIWRNAASPLSAEPAERYAVYRELPPEQLQGLQVLKHELAERHARGERPRMEILGLGGAWQNASMVLGLEDTIGYNPLRLADYERAVGAGENAVDPNLRHFPGTFRGYRCSLAGLLGLEYLVLDRPLERLPKHFPRLSNAKLLYGSGTMWVYRLSPSAPRVYLASRLIPVESETVLAQEELPEFDRTDEALIDHHDVAQVKGDYGLRDTVTDPDPPQGSAKIASYGRNEVIVEVETDRNSVVVLHDIYYPGWEAYVDGERRPILRANLLFRGVEVPPGRYRLEFRFRPLSVDNLVAAATGLLASDEADAETAIQ